LEPPKINAGKYWSKKTRQNNFKLFLEGYYIKPIAPYAMRRVPIKKSRQKNRSSRWRYVLEPGDPEKVEIVRLIFELFVIHDYSLTDICNLLNSQGVKSPLKCNTWKTRVVRTILESETYIGANEFSGCVKHGVFPSFIDKAVFFEAQAKISRNQLTLKLRKRSVKPISI
ncbi:MAG: recombinase family protein, partial [Desulfobacterales bacterium]